MGGGRYPQTAVLGSITWLSADHAIA